MLNKYTDKLRVFSLILAVYMLVTNISVNYIDNLKTEFKLVKNIEGDADTDSETENEEKLEIEKTKLIQSVHLFFGRDLATLFSQSNSFFFKNSILKILDQKIMDQPPEH